MKHYLLVRVKTPKKTSFLLKCNRLNVDMKEICYEKQYIKFRILESDLKRLRKYLVSYPVEVINETGIYKLKKELKKNILLITAIIFAVVIFLILSNIIVKINIVHEDAHLRKLISDALTEKGVTPLSFRKSYDEYEAIIESIKDEYPDQIEWLEIDVEGMIINIRVEERIIMNYEKEENTCHIIASKSGIIKSIRAEKGVSEVSINDYVDKGDILINGSIKLNDEVKENVCASGTIYAEVWYQAHATIPMTEKKSEDTGKMRYNFMIKKGSKETVVLKSRIDGEKRVENIYLFSLFGIEFYLQKEYEVEIEEITYQTDEALEKGVSEINEKLELKLDNFESIIEEKVLQKKVKDNNIYIEMFIAVKEQIGIREYFDETRSDTSDEDDNEHTNGVN